MKNKYLSPLTLITLLLIASACSKSPVDNPTPPDPTPGPVVTPDEKLEIKISPSVATRATDYGFETNDRIGLFVVNYNGNVPGSLLNSGNHVDNMRFTYSGTWTPDSPIYWKDETTHADFYLYYPYSQVGSVTAYPFSVRADQSTEAAYKASDMLVGKAENVSPTASVTVIPANHVMSRINIQLEAGNGFTKESLAQAKISVKINGVKTNATVNLATGVATATGNPTTIIPRYTEGSYIALIVPQSVSGDKLISVTVDDREFTLKKNFTFEAAKSHKFTVTLSKTSNGVNVNINPWNEDGIDNGGVAE